MRRSSPDCCSASRRIASRTCRRFSRSRRFPMPFALLGLHRYLRDPRPKWLALFAGGMVPAGALQRVLPAVFQRVRRLVDSVVREPVVAAAGSFSRSASHGSLPPFRYCRFCCATARFTRRSGSRAISAPSASSAPTWRACCMRRSISRCGDGCDVFRRPEGELFPGLTVALLVMAGAMFVRDRGQAHVNSWTLARRILIVLTVVTAARLGQRRHRRAVAAGAVRHPTAVGGESHQAADVFARARARCSH